MLKLSINLILKLKNNLLHIYYTQDNKHVHLVIFIKMLLIHNAKNKIIKLSKHLLKHTNNLLNIYYTQDKIIKMLLIHRIIFYKV